MLWRMLKQSWFRNVRRKSLAVFTVFLAAGLISSLLAVSIDIGDKMSRELKSYGANILIEPAGQVALPSLFGEQSNPLSGQDFLDQAELPNIKDIFGVTILLVLPHYSVERLKSTDKPSRYWAPTLISPLMCLTKRIITPVSKLSAHIGRSMATGRKSQSRPNLSKFRPC